MQTLQAFFLYLCNNSFFLKNLSYFMYAKKVLSLFGTLPNRDSFCFLDLCFCLSLFAYGGYTNPHLVAFIKRSGFQTIFFFVIILFSFLRKKPETPFIIIFGKVNALLLLFYKKVKKEWFLYEKLLYGFFVLFIKVCSCLTALNTSPDCRHCASSRQLQGLLYN